jgi:hypothetical protein
VLLARAVLKTEAPKRTLAACGLLLALIPLAAAVLPETLHSGLRHVSWSGVPWLYCGVAVPVGAAAYWLARRRAAAPALALLALVTSAGWLYIKVSALPVVDQVASARPLWGRIQAHRDDACVDTLNRALRYGLNYYSVTPLADCAASPARYRIRQDARHDVQIVFAETPPAPSPE